MELVLITMRIRICILDDQLWVKEAALESCFHQENVPVILSESLRYVRDKCIFLQLSCRFIFA